MPNQNDKRFSDYIIPLEINGMSGRMLKMPALESGKREILLIYGHHASLERMEGLADLLNDYGSVTMADLPGFGGMDSFYKIGQKPTLDNLTDYLAAVIKLRYRNKRFTIIGVSFGFVIATRMLQKYPEIAKRVNLLISVVGFMNKDEFKFSKPRLIVYKSLVRVFSYHLPAAFFRNVILHPFVIRSFYSRTHNGKHKFKNLTPEQYKRAIEFEVHLWRCNDVKTHMYTGLIMVNLDNCKKQINLPVHHVMVKKDNYFDNHIVEQHMRVVFNDYTAIPIKMNNHAVSIIANKKESAPLVPPKLRNLLAQAP